MLRRSTPAKVQIHTAERVLNIVDDVLDGVRAGLPSQTETNIADIGLATTGVAGPDEVEGKPVGTVHIAIDDGRDTRLHSGQYPPLRLDVKRRATLTALVELRRALLGRR